MADELTQEEIEAREELTALLVEEARLGKKANEQAIRDYLTKTKTGKAMAGLGKATTDVTSGFKDSAKAMASSTGDFGNLTGAVGGTVKAVSGLMGALNDIAGEIPFIGGAAEAMGDAFIGVTTFAFGEVQKGFDTFQDLSRAGLIGADGISGMAEQMRATNMPLATYSKLLKQNSEDLSFLSTSALAGGKTFSKVMIDMAGDTGQPLRRLGLSVEEIGETVVDFQVMQRRQGLLDSLSQAEINKGTVAYAKELDLIAKLTGKSREGIQKEREEAMSDARFRASIAELDTDTQKQHMNAISQISDPTLKRAYMDQLSGFTNSTASITTEIQGMGGALREAQALINSGNGDSTEAINLMRTQALEMTKVGGVFQQHSKVVESGTSVMGNFANLADFAVKRMQKQDEIAAAQLKLADTAGTQTDKLATAMREMQTVTSAMNNFFIATPHATTAISEFAGIMKETTTYIEQTLLGKNPLTDMGGVELSNMALEKVSPWHEGAQALGSATYDGVEWLKNKFGGSSDSDESPYAPVLGSQPGAELQPDADTSVLAPKVAKELATSNPVTLSMPNIAKATEQKQQDLKEQKAKIDEYRNTAAVDGFSESETRELKEMRVLLNAIKFELISLNNMAVKQKNLQADGNRIAQQ